MSRHYGWIKGLFHPLPRDVVWGIGGTAEEANAEAREGLRQDGTPDTVTLRTQEISAGDVAAVEGGDVDAARLGRR